MNDEGGNRTMLRLVLALMLALGCSTAAAARPSVPIVDYYNQQIVGAAAPASIDSVRQAIATAAASRKWTITGSGSGHMVATLVIRNKHTLVIDIRYTATVLDLRYRDSTNLNYVKFDNGVRLIHPAYNTEVKALLDAINAALQQPKTG
jgi:hypothetical protein